MLCAPIGGTLSAMCAHCNYLGVLAVIGGWSPLAVGGGWQLVAIGGWRLVVPWGGP